MRRAPAVGAACIAALALAGCAATPPEEDPVQIKLHDLDTRLARIERVVANQSLLQLANDVESLRSDVRALHNDVDELSHNLEANRKQQRDLYADLDQRMKSLEGRAAGRGAVLPRRPAAARPPAPRPARRRVCRHRRAPIRPPIRRRLRLLKDSQYDRAITAFQSFLAILSKQSARGKRTVLARRSLLREQILPGSVGRLSARGGPVPAIAQAARCAAQDRLLRLRAQAVAVPHETCCRRWHRSIRIRRPAIWRKQRLEKMAAEKH